MRAIVDDSQEHAAPLIVLSLLFAPGGRPRADDIVRLAASSGTFGISHRPPDDDGWLELIASGLTFDLRGLVPAAPAATFAFVHRYALAEDIEPGGLEHVTLAPGPHLAGAEAMMPVVRAAAMLATALAELPECHMIGWRPARAVSGAGYFCRAIDRWLGGGAFPALGLVALTRTGEGALRSEGLDFLVGRELLLAPGGASPADDAKLAVRLIDFVVEGAIGEEPVILEAMPGVMVSLTDDRAARLIRARRSRP